MALDLGGTNFRVLYAQMREGVLINSKSHHYEIPYTVLKVRITFILSGNFYVFYFMLCVSRSI